MKWSVLGLILLGVVAAFFAALLFANLNTPKQQAAAPTTAPAGNTPVTIAMAARDLPQDHIVLATDVEMCTTQPAAAGENYVPAAQVVGKVLCTSMVKGQSFTTKNFPTEGSGSDLASKIPAGKRAVSVAMSDYSGSEYLLYPGCKVDVQACYTVVVPNTNMTVPASSTILTNVEVLAIDDKTILGPTTGPAAKPDTNRLRRKVVTLLVDAKQAEKVQLAQEKGTVSVAIRNPLDLTTYDPKGLTAFMTLSEEGLMGLIKGETPKVTSVPPATQPGTAVDPPQATEQPKKTWTMTVVQGGKTDKWEFTQPEKPEKPEK